MTSRTQYYFLALTLKSLTTLGPYLTKKFRSNNICPPMHIRAYWKTIFLEIHFAPGWLLCSRSIQNIRKKQFLISTTGTVSKMTFYFTKELAPKYKGKFCILVFWIFSNILFLWNDSKPLRSFCLINTLLLIPILL